MNSPTSYILTNVKKGTPFVWGAHRVQHYTKRLEARDQNKALGCHAPKLPCKKAPPRAKPLACLSADGIEALARADEAEQKAGKAKPGKEPRLTCGLGQVPGS